MADAVYQHYHHNHHHHHHSHHYGFHLHNLVVLKCPYTIFSIPQGPFQEYFPVFLGGDGLVFHSLCPFHHHTSSLCSVL